MLMANGGRHGGGDLGSKARAFLWLLRRSDGIGTALMMLRTGMIDAALAGASEATITSTGVAAFDRVGAMSRRNDTYTMTPQPFDKNRDGLVMGEGAAVLVLERESDAKARGANILAELAGYGATADAYHVTAPHEHGAGGAAAMLMALSSAKANIEDVGYINAHGTRTALNVSETRAEKPLWRTGISAHFFSQIHDGAHGCDRRLGSDLLCAVICEGILPPTIHTKPPILNVIWITSRTCARSKGLACHQ